MLRSVVKKFFIYCYLLGFPTFVNCQEVRSFFPIFSENEAILADKAEGKWLFDFMGMDTLVITKKGDNFYEVYTARSNHLYEGMFGIIDSALFLQLLPVGFSDNRVIDKNEFIPVYSIYKVDVVDTVLKLAGMRYGWIFERIQDKEINGFVWSSNAIVLTLPSPEFRKFVTKNLRDAQFLENNLSLSLTSKTKLSSAPPNRVSSQPVTYYSNCIPAFPLKDGWLGGDGNVSVATSNTRTIWLFSDSFVGAKDQNSRRGTSIVGNSIGIMNCENGSPSMNYYWKNKLTQHPKPFFETYTDRYKFWITDGFLYGGRLFVVLQKIGPKTEPPAVNETFNFAHVGWSIGVVENPLDDPEKWKFDLTPINIFNDKEWDGQMVLKDNFAYFFKKKSKGSFLCRVHSDSIETGMEGIEYFSIAKTWKPGKGGDDAEILFSGDDGQTVEYHSDIRKWVMVVGPGFLNNKIRIRTAQALTGPWSAEKVIYECPEQTPGSKVYHKDNFCYLGREHIQFYNKKAQRMVLTYDYNTADFVIKNINRR